MHFQFGQRFLRAPGQAEYFSEVVEGAGVQFEEVGPRGQLDRFAGQSLGGLDIATVGKELGLHAPPTDLGVQVVRHRP